MKLKPDHKRALWNFGRAIAFILGLLLILPGPRSEVSDPILPPGNLLFQTIMLVASVVFSILARRPRLEIVLDVLMFVLLTLALRFWIIEVGPMVYF